MPVKTIGTASKRSASTTTQVQVEPSGEQHDLSNGKMPHLTSKTFVYPGQIDNAILLQPNDQYKVELSNLHPLNIFLYDPFFFHDLNASF